MTYRYKYCDYNYIYDGEANSYQVVPNKKIGKPQTFFKYYALSDNSVSALTEMYLYATHPYQLNDPFDCNVNLVEFKDWLDVEKLFNGTQMQNPHEFFPCLEDALAFSRSAYRTILYRKLGVVSLAPCLDNYLMWSLYAQNNGFCVELDAAELPFRHFGPFPVNYVDYFDPPIRIGEVGGNLSMLIQTNVKNKWWQHENEWRLLIPNPIGLDMQSFGNQYPLNFNFGDEHDRKFRYSTNAVKSVVLGSRFFDRLHPVVFSNAELDVACDSKDNKLEFQVLDFLARITEKTDLTVKRAILNGFDSCIFALIRVLKYEERRFRIICNNV